LLKERKETPIRIIHILTKGKTVIVSGLSTDYKMEQFGYLSDMIHFADEIIHKKAKCSVCKETNIYKAAPFTERICQSKAKIYISSNIDEYRPVCRKHHNMNIC
jgi:thymidine kinase